MTRDESVRALGLVTVTACAACVVWLYVKQPQTLQEVTGSLAAGIGVYHVDRPAFDDGLRFFRQDQFAAARSAFGRADAAGQDPATQFYIAYSYYREGWGRVYDDDELFARGLAYASKAAALAPGGNVRVEDPNLQMRSTDELKAELEAGLRTEAADLNPFKIFRTRK